MSAMSELAFARDEEPQPDTPEMFDTGDEIDYGAGDVFSLDGVDDDILSDLAAVGITVRGVKDVDAPLRTEAIVTDAAHRTALAALFLRLAAEEEQAIAGFKATMMVQVGLVTAHYERIMERHAARRDQCVRQVESIARVAIAAGDFGKKKSASTPFGDFGVKDCASTLQIADPDALLAHLSTHAPDYVRVTAKLPLTQAREYLTAAELSVLKAEPLWGELKKSLTHGDALPPGVVQVQGTRTAFAKPMMPFTGTDR